MVLLRLDADVVGGVLAGLLLFAGLAVAAAVANRPRRWEIDAVARRRRSAASTAPPRRPESGGHRHDWLEITAFGDPRHVFKCAGCGATIEGEPVAWTLRP